jgi:multidrug resistance efflux pump
VSERSDKTGSATIRKLAQAVAEPSLPKASLSDRVRSLRLPKEPARSSARSAWLPWTVCAILAISTGTLAYLNFAKAGTEQPKEATDKVESAKAAAPIAAAEHGIASSGDVALERKGYIIPAHQILLSPKVSGVIEKLYIEEGMRVKKDQVLAELEITDYKSDYDHARATVVAAWQRFLELYTGNRDQEIRQAKAELEEMEANLKQLYLDWKRNTRLQSNSALAAKDYEIAESQYRAMDRRVEKMRQAYGLMLEGARPEKIEAAWAEVEQAEADLAKAKWRLDNCMVRAPISGTILTKKAEIGNLVNPVAFAGSLNICEMADLADLEVDMSIEERDISKVFKGQRCKVRPEAFMNQSYNGYVSRLMPTADRAKSAIPVRVKLTVPKEEEGVYLKPEMGVLVSFLKREAK